ncbi:MAG: hypothetical protein ACR2KV_13140 [Solirubrobacteraceae bacterium]
MLALGFSGAPAWADETTIIAGTQQSDAQGVDSSQSAVNGDTMTAFPPLGDSTPATTRDSANVLVDGQGIGGGAGDTTVIAFDPSQCVCQGSRQGVNSDQVGGGGQSSANVLLNGHSWAAAPTTSP